jgi:hypothetical protein
MRKTEVLSSMWGHHGERGGVRSFRMVSSAPSRPRGDRSWSPGCRVVADITIGFGFDARPANSAARATTNATARAMGWRRVGGTTRSQTSAACAMCSRTLPCSRSPIHPSMLAVSDSALLLTPEADRRVVPAPAIRPSAACSTPYSQFVMSSVVSSTPSGPAEMSS